MRRTVRTALCALLVAIAGTGAAAAGDCAVRAVEVLRTASPGGYAVYRQVEDKAFFRTWIDCADAQFGLPTAVHESVHLLTGDADAYPLIGGGAIARPPEGVPSRAPATIAHRFQPSIFVATYLRPGSATSAADFRYLLDELNAYTHDLDVALALDPLRDPEVQPSHRDGLAALMSFVAVYVEAAQADPATWNGLTRPETRSAVSALWTQAERTMAASCGVPGIGTEDRLFLTALCARGPQAALGRLLGRAPVCPKTCLGAGARTASRN